MANEKEVKAQVKLRFKAANGQTLMVTRNLSVSVKKGGGMTSKTLEGILSFASNDGPNGKVNPVPLFSGLC
jgi:DNA repair protein RAD50